MLFVILFACETWYLTLNKLRTGCWEEYLNARDEVKEIVYKTIHRLCPKPF
jgi:hypothetical protein